MEHETCFEQHVPEFMDLVTAAGHRARLSIALSLLFAVLFGWIAWSIVPPSFEAQSYIQVRNKPDFIYVPAAQADGDKFFVAQQQRLLSQPILKAALRREEVLRWTSLITGDATAWLREHMRVDVKSQAELLCLSFSHPQAEAALAFNSAIINAFIDDYLQTRSADRAFQLEKLQQAAEAADQQLNLYWQQLDRIVEHTGAIDIQQLTVQDQLQLQGYRDYARQLRQSERRGKELRHLLSQAEVRSAEPPVMSEAMIDELIKQAPEHVSAHEELLALQSRLESMEDLVSDREQSRLTVLRQQRDELRRDIESQRSVLRPAIRERLVSTHRVRHDVEVERYRAELEANEDERAFLSDMLSQIEAVLDRRGQSGGLQLEMLRRTLDRQARLADRLWTAVEQQKIESQSQPRLTLLETAELPREADSRQRIKTTAAASGGAFLITLLCIGFFEWRSCRVHTPTDLAVKAGCRLLGITAYRRRIGCWWSVKNDYRRLMLSGVHEAVAQLTLPQPSLQPHVVVVSSAVVTESRHALAAELASAVHHAGRQVLLIDADQSSPALSQSYQLDNCAGLLQAGEDLAQIEALVHTTRTGIRFLPRGQETNGYVDYPVRVDNVIKHLGNSYHTIIICAAPALDTSESVILIAKADTVLLAAALHHSRWNLLSATDRRLKSTGAGPSGVILCGPPWRKWSPLDL